MVDGESAGTSPMDEQVANNNGVENNETATATIGGGSNSTGVVASSTTTTTRTTKGQADSGDEGPRKRSASPASACQSNEPNPAKVGKFCKSTRGDDKKLDEINEGSLGTEETADDEDEDLIVDTPPILRAEEREQLDLELDEEQAERDRLEMLSDRDIQENDDIERPERPSCPMGQNEQQFGDGIVDKQILCLFLLQQANLHYPADDIERALVVCNNNVEAAISMLNRELSDAAVALTKGDGGAGNGGIIGPMLPGRHGFEPMDNRYVESDEEDVPDDERSKWNNDDVQRVRDLLEVHRKSLFFRKNGSLYRCIVFCTNILAEQAEHWQDALHFVDEILHPTITRHVNPNDDQVAYMGIDEAQCIEDFYTVLIPLLCRRLEYSPINVRNVLALDELFNPRNRFFSAAASLLEARIERVYLPTKYVDSDKIEKLTNKNIFGEHLDRFVQLLMDSIDRRMLKDADKIWESSQISDIAFLLRSINCFTKYLNGEPDLRYKMLDYVECLLHKLHTATDRDIRDSNYRRHGLDALEMAGVVCDRLNVSISEKTERHRLEFMRKWIKCPQMEAMLCGFEQIGHLAPRADISNNIGRSKLLVSEEYLKRWIDENKVLQIVLTGNMDNVTYVEKIQPILQYLAPALTLDEMKFIWSLRKGRMGVSMENFNRIIEFISKSVKTEQILWLIDLFKKSFRQMETRLYESIFHYCYGLATQKDSTDTTKAMIGNAMWELIKIARGPPTGGVSFKSIEVGMKKHCDLINQVYDRTYREKFICDHLAALNEDETFTEISVVYLVIMLEKIKRLYNIKKGYGLGENAIKLNDIRDVMRRRGLFDIVLDRLETVRKTAHETFESNYERFQQGHEPSQSNAVFESTSDQFNNEYVDNILTTLVLKDCTTYGFVLGHSLRLLKWLHDNEAATLTLEVVERIFDVFISPPDAKNQEKAEIFQWLCDLKTSFIGEEVSRGILTALSKLDYVTLSISGLKCFSKFWEELPFIFRSDCLESYMEQTDTECQLYIWKLILFNQSDEVVDKCIEAFCEREVIAIEDPISMRHHTYGFLSVLSYYMEQLKTEFYTRSKRPQTEVKYNTQELEMSQDEIERYEVPLNNMLIDSISRAMDRLVRFLTRFVELGNEKNNMIRQNPSHGSRISGHKVIIHIECKVDEDETEHDFRTIVCDSNTTIGEFKVRIGRRLQYEKQLQNAANAPEFVSEFSIHRRDATDLYLQEMSMRYDYLTLQSVRLANEKDSIFSTETMSIVTKHRKTRITGRSAVGETKKGIREDYLPAAMVSDCNFYELLHELAALGDTHIRHSVRKLLLLLPTQPSVIQLLTFQDGETQTVKDELDDDTMEVASTLPARVLAHYDEFIAPNEPNKMLYGLEGLSSIVVPTTVHPTACQASIELAVAILESGILRKLMDWLKTPEKIDLQLCSKETRHAIYERIVQIMRAVYTAHSNTQRSIENEAYLRELMRRMAITSRVNRSLIANFTYNVEHLLVKHQVAPMADDHEVLKNNPTLAIAQNVTNYRDVFRARTREYAVNKWHQEEFLEFLQILRDFSWIHMATDCLNTKRWLTTRYMPEDDEIEMAENMQQPTASEKIRTGATSECWTDECRFLLVRKVLSLFRCMVEEWGIGKEARDLQSFIPTIFLSTKWKSFFEDLLVNHNEKDYRSFGHSMIRKLGFAHDALFENTVRLLLDIYDSMPFKKYHTADLSENQRRQRRHFDVVSTSINDLFAHYRLLTKSVNRQIDWSLIGYSPLVITQTQITSMTDFKPRFSTTDHELCHTEQAYAIGKLQMIATFSMFLTSEQFDDCTDEFLQCIISDFLFPEQPNVQESMFEVESVRWEGSTREHLIHFVNQLCERSYKNMWTVYSTCTKFLAFTKSFDPNLKPITRPRVHDKVGLKNDGGTCYMNATIQQLVMVPGLASQLIRVHNIDPKKEWGEYHSALVFELQRVFAQLMYSRAQAVVPEGLWHTFQFEPNVPLNTKQHHDAIDFYSILMDRCDHVLKKLDNPPIFQDKFFGKYSYEKICYGCWHRYKSPDEEFNCISLALNGDNLEDAIESFLEAHVMEGENAYHCEKCDEKKTTLNRTSFLELPNTMTIQLKRFTYDVINGQIKKDNQFFKFPFEIDMEPYMTASRHVPDEEVQALFDDMLVCNNEPQRNGIVAEEPKEKATTSSSSNSDSPQKKGFRRHRASNARLSQSFASTSQFDVQVKKTQVYELVGVLAHSGIATAGHYYSFVKERRDEFKDSATYGKWYHFNDMQVAPMQMNNLEDQWFGGCFSPDNGFEDRTRHWNAYVLFYELKKNDDQLTTLPLTINDQNSNKPRQKVTFDMSDGEMQTDEMDEEEKRKKDMSPARKLRIATYEQLDDRLKGYLNRVNAQWLEDRDFYSNDIYNLFISPLYQFNNNMKDMPYTFTHIDKTQFINHIFMTACTYIFRVCFLMYDETRPKSFPRPATDVIRQWLTSSPSCKYYLFKAMDHSNPELYFHRIMEISDVDVRIAFWTNLRAAMKLFYVEQIRMNNKLRSPTVPIDHEKMIEELRQHEMKTNENVAAALNQQQHQPQQYQRPDDDDEMMEESSMDSDDIDEDDEDDELDDEDTESDGDMVIERGDNERISRMRVQTAQPAMQMNQLLSANNRRQQQNLADQSKMKGNQVRAQEHYLLTKIITSNPYMTMPLQVLRKAATAVLDSRFTNVRTDCLGRHIARMPLEFFIGTFRECDFARDFINSACIIPFFAELLFEEFSVPVYARLRFTEHRQRTNGLWPHLPELLFEMLDYNLMKVLKFRIGESKLAKKSGEMMNPQVIIHAQLINECLQLYGASREDSDDPLTELDTKDELLYNKITSVFAKQIMVKFYSPNPCEAEEFIREFTQILLREVCTQCIQIVDDQWNYCVLLVCEIIQNLINDDERNLAYSVFENFMEPRIPDNLGRRDNFHRGVLSEANAYVTCHCDDRARRVMSPIGFFTHLKDDRIQRQFSRWRNRYVTILRYLRNERNANRYARQFHDDEEEQEEEEELDDEDEGIGGDERRRSVGGGGMAGIEEVNTNFNERMQLKKNLAAKTPNAVATATVTETKDINLAECLNNKTKNGDEDDDDDDDVKKNKE